MEPSETERGRRWLNNFLLADQPSAKLLLDGLELLGQDQLRQGLSEVISGLAEALATPIALVPVRELASGQSYYPIGRESRPRLLLPNSFPGSEAIVANILTGARRAEENAGPFVAAPSLRNMRAARCRTIMFVDDFCGSGDRVIRFAEGYSDHPTIQSWTSYHLIEFHVCAYVMTQAARRRLVRRFGEGRVHAYRICPTLESQGWDAEDVQAVEKVCRQYVSPNNYIDPLGYRGTGGLLALSHSVPNNLPPILWQTHRKGHPDWEPFFLGKAVPDDLLPLFGVSITDRQREAALKRLGQMRLGQTDWGSMPSTAVKNMFLVLAAVAKCPRERHVIAEITGLSVKEVNEGLGACLNHNLVDRTLHLTDAGRAELRHAKGVRLPEEEINLRGSTTPYYPQSLRVGVDL